METLVIIAGIGVAWFVTNLILTARSKRQFERDTGLTVEESMDLMAGKPVVIADPVTRAIWESQGFVRPGKAGLRLAGNKAEPSVPADIAEYLVSFEDPETDGDTQ